MSQGTIQTQRQKQNEIMLEFITQWPRAGHELQKPGNISEHQKHNTQTVHSLIMLDPNWIWLYAPGVH